MNKLNVNILNISGKNRHRMLTTDVPQLQAHKRGYKTRDKASEYFINYLKTIIEDNVFAYQSNP